MTTTRRARTRERMVAMLAIGFCLGVLTTTYVTWRREVLGLGREAPGPALPTVAPPAVPQRDDDGAVTPEEIVRTAPAVGSADAPPRPAPPVTATDREILRSKPLRMPIDGVARAALQPSFDQARGARRHEALDILSPRGTPVRAVEAGTVARLFTSERGGITVYQYDPSGTYCYYYAHLDRYADGLREGQEISAGEVIGYVGTSGNAPPDTPHLHFAIFRMPEPGRWWEGSPIDPYEVLR